MFIIGYPLWGSFHKVFIFLAHHRFEEKKDHTAEAALEVDQPTDPPLFGSPPSLRRKEGQNKTFREGS